MAFKKGRPGKIVVDLTGPDGNAFALMGIMKNILLNCCYTREEINNIQEEMVAGNYEQLVEIFEREVGEYVDIYGKDEVL
jgi:hypothetical protein